MVADTRDGFVLALKWTCQECGWTATMDAPGFAGDGRHHFSDGRTPCGPITAQKVHATGATLAIVYWHRRLTGESGYAPSKWVNLDGSFNVVEKREEAEPVPRWMAEKIAAHLRQGVATNVTLIEVRQ